MPSFTRHLWIALTVMVGLLKPATAQSNEHWFETLKQSGDDRTLYQVLHAMPKGGDLHNHTTGSVFVEDWLSIALADAANGYTFYAKVRINNCREYDQADTEYLLLFRNIPAYQYDALNDCEKGEFKALGDLNDAERKGWLNSLRLNDAEGREEFFSTHWERLEGLLVSPYVRAEALFHNMRGLGDDNASYLEAQIGLSRTTTPTGEPIDPETVLDIYRARLAAPDAVATGVTVRLQLMLLRFAPDAEASLRNLYALAVNNRDILVGLNMAGREDNDKGHPRRFLNVLRELRQQSALPLAIHAGEVDEPNDHVRDTLLIGAKRIGHGLNLITDDDLMLDLRYGPYLIEINLISNLLLEYVVDYSQHPFPEYLRTGIPVALSTDDRGMWDSTFTDEYFVGVKEFDLTWAEIVSMSRNSLQYAFVQEPVKAKLLDEFDAKIKRFERLMRKAGLAKNSPFPDTRTFICARYQICD
ncbi:MAG: adenosine deaminase [Pseudomonadota bacterium]